MRRTRFGAALAFAVAILGSAGSAAAEAPSTRKFTLENGLDVVLVEDHRAPLVSIDLKIDVGSRDDPPSRKGLGRLLELLLLDPSTRHVGRDVADKMFRALHVEPIVPAATYTNDYTLLAWTVPSNELALALWLESDRLAFAVDGFDQAAIDRARDTIDGERRHALERQDDGAVPGLVNAALYRDHPYATGAIGLPADVVSITRADVLKHFDAFYGPNDTTLVVAGDLDPAAAEKLVRTYFGPIVRRDEPTHVEAAPPTLDGERRVAIEAAVQTPRVVLAWPTPAYLADGDAELDVVAALLGDVRGGRLKKRLETSKVGRLAEVRQRSHAMASELVIEIVLEAGQKPAAAIAMVDEELEKIRKGAVADAELAAARLGLANRVALRLDSVAGRAMMHAAQNHHGKPSIDGPGPLVDRYRAVTLAGVERAVSQHLPLARRVVAIVTPDASAPRGGRLQEAR